MTKAFSNWLRDRRFHAMVSELEALAPGDLRALGIEHMQINHLALELSRVEHTHRHRPIIALVAVIGLSALWVLSPTL
jgi:hypothetical protein